jgi:disulfide bond formation protein DsbB
VLTVSQWEVVFSLLGLVANIALVVIAGSWLLSRRFHAASMVVTVAHRYALMAAWLVAATCMAGSLYFSERAHFLPCKLCWYQRICMYPLVAILLVALIVGDRAVRRYVLPLTLVGAAISTYHYFLEWFPESDLGVCSATIPCDFVWFRRFGFASLPYLALSGFLLITVLVLVRPRENS